MLINPPTGTQLPGSNTNDSAAAGNVGEFISATLLVGSAVNLTSTTVANITSISLTAGDWDVWGTIVFAPASTTTLTIASGWTSTTSATNPTIPNSGAYFQLQGQTFTGAATIVGGVNPQRISLNATTTVFLSCVATFATAACTAYGFIGARRRR